MDEGNIFRGIHSSLEYVAQYLLWPHFVTVTLTKFSHHTCKTITETSK